MDTQVRKDSISILQKVLKLLKAKENLKSVELKELSDHTIHNASVFQDECSVSVAVFLYSLSKIIERSEDRINFQTLILKIEKVVKTIEDNDEQKFTDSMRSLIKDISALDNRIKLYVKEVVTQAQIKKGSKLCEHGLSCGKASEVLGVSQWELMDYMGKTMLNESVPNIIDTKSRLSLARELLP
jgi:hypothetical protein